MLYFKSRHSPSSSATGGVFGAVPERRIVQLLTPFSLLARGLEPPLELLTLDLLGSELLLGLGRVHLLSVLVTVLFVVRWMW